MIEILKKLTLLSCLVTLFWALIIQPPLTRITDAEGLTDSQRQDLYNNPNWVGDCGVNAADLTDQPDTTPLTSTDDTTPGTDAQSYTYLSKGNIPKSGTKVKASIFGGTYSGGSFKPTNDKQNPGGANNDDNGAGNSSSGIAGKAGYAELSINPSAQDYKSLGGLPEHTKLQITYKGKSVIAEKLDVGAGGDQNPKIDLWWETAKLLDFKNGIDDVTLHVVPNNTPTTPVGGNARDAGASESTQEQGGGCCSNTPAPETAAPASAPADQTSLTDDQKISATFNIGFSPSTSKSTIESIVKKYKIGGVFILGTNDAAGAGFDKAFFDKLNKAAGHTLVSSSDEEGVFKRYKYSFDFPDATKMGKMSDADVSALGKKVGTELSKNGINTDLAPVLDVSKSSSGTDAGTSGRAFSDDPDVVTKKAGAFAEGLQQGGVSPVYKHFPGLGSISGNTDTESASTSSLDKLKAKDLKPYESLVNKNNAAVMMDNARVPGLTESGTVASTSPAAVKLLQDDYKFQGLITTDDLGAKGVSGSTSDAIADSLKAGVDMPLFAFTSTNALDTAIGAAKSAGVSTDKSLQKIADFVNGGQKTSSDDSAKIGCCPKSSDSGTTSLDGKGNGEKVFNYFISKGLNNMQAAAFTGNLQQESNFSTTVDNGQGYHALAQWGDARWTKLQGKSDYTNLSVQLDYIWEELQGGWSGALTHLKASKTLEDATFIVVKEYEGAVSSSQPRGVQNYAARLQYAQAWFKKAQAGGGGSASDSTTPATTDDSSSDTTTTDDTDDNSCSSEDTSASTPGEYKSPFRSKDGLVESRIDEGVDYASTKPVPVYAIGNGVVTLATSHSTFYTTSHGHSDWITYRLTDGPAKGKYIYISEACPIRVHTGQKVTTETHMCDVLPDSIEMGWASTPTGQYAAAYGVYKEGYETAYGVNFNELMKSLGAPGGHLDTASDPSGTVLGKLPANWPKWSKK